MEKRVVDLDASRINREIKKMTREQWHEFLRTAFRAHLFQFVGCYEMTVCGLIAPLNSGTLKIFRLAFEDAANTEDDTKCSQTCIQTAFFRVEQPIELLHIAVQPSYT